jgi:hypothetical protein
MKRSAFVALALTATLLIAGCTDSHTERTTVGPTASDGLDLGHLSELLGVCHLPEQGVDALADR